jgi:hypothetical protein
VAETQPWPRRHTEYTPDEARPCLTQDAPAWFRRHDRRPDLSSTGPPDARLRHDPEVRLRSFRDPRHEQ